MAPSLPIWMARVSGALLILAGVAWPVLTMPVSGQTSPAVAAAAPEMTPEVARLALTPPMGWNGFNHFVHNVTETQVEAQARALLTTGMRAAGYTYVNLDGGWDLLARGPAGELQPDPQKFPDGIKHVADYVHALGLKFGIYTSAGSMNCAHTSAGSYGHYLQDAATFASWGVDYLKFDWCYIPYRLYPGLTQRQVGQMLAEEMRNALAASGRPILYDVNDYWGGDDTWTWAPTLGAHMWRTAQDSKDHYQSMLANFIHNVGRFKSAGPGNWNDPDMLEVGNGGMSTIEYESQFSLWAEMAAPLIAGNDLTAMSEVTRGILTNQAVIAVDQDPLGRQGRPISDAGGHWVLVKELAGGSVAVVLFNSTNRTATISTSANQLDLPRAYAYRVVDLWSHSASDTAGLIWASLPAHGAAMYVVSALWSANE